MQISQQALQDLANDPANAPLIRESQELMRSIVKRSATDAQFRKLLLTSPKTAIVTESRETFGRTLNESDISIDIRFVESVDEMTLVLPQEVDPAAELSEDDLATVAGGSLLLLAASYAAGVAVSLGVTWAVKKIVS